MQAEELKKIINETLENYAPYLNEKVYKIVNKIIKLEDGEKSSITELLGDSELTQNQLFDLYLCVNKVCKKIGIILDFSSENAKTDGLLYEMLFKKYSINKKSEL